MCDKTPSSTEGSSKNVDDGADLSELMNEALKEFGDVKPSTVPKSNDAKVDAELPDFLDKDMAQKAAADFQNMLKQLAAVQQAAMEKGEALPTDDLAPTSSGDDDEQAKKFLDNLTKLTDKAGKVAGAHSEDDFVKTMQEFQDEGFQNDLMPFMHGLMSSLMSKEMMYPSLKEMTEKYPQWLRDNQETTSAQDLQRYREQLKIIIELVRLYDEEKDEDPAEMKAHRFEQIIMHMQQMQMCGHPPQELVGDLPAGWGFDDSTGMPQVVDSQAAADNPQCSLM